MELASYLKLLVIAALLFYFPAIGLGQTPPLQEQPEVTIGDIRIDQARLPGSKLSWAKIVIGFTSQQKWADGILLSVQALLDDKSQQRIVSGVVRYGNVPEGKQTAVFYLSPRTVTRFGSPIAIKVAAFYKDKEAGTKNWTDGKSVVPQSWDSLNVYPGILLNVMQTPWLMIDYEQSPDVIAIQ